ncbi:MAG: hypothetical protein V7720_11315 [Halioglobus sp.]
MEQPQETVEDIIQTPDFPLLRQAGLHLGLWILAFSLFAATDSWSQLTGWQLASLLNVLTGIAAGFITVNLVHEWFHYLGAKLTSGNYTLKTTPSLFVFDWNFETNKLNQFYTMSIAGSIGGAVALVAVFNSVDTDSAGRAALAAGAAASFAFGSIIEWPVLARTRRSKNPLQELSKITPSVLVRAATGSTIIGLISWFALT